MSKHSLEDWLGTIYQVNPFKVELGLTRLKQFLQRHPLHLLNVPIITVTGTNGKGSTVAFLSQILTQSGYRVGTFTSPHIFRFNERIQINGEPVSDECLCQAFATVESLRGEIDLTFFEYAFLSSLVIFQAAELDILVYEVGVGGSRDAVNCLDADVSIITTIDFDHQQWLGNTRNEIAAEKVGILRSGKPLICGDLDPPIAIFCAAEKLTSPLYLLGRDFHFQQEGSSWEFQNDTFHWQGLNVPHLPIANAAIACQALSVMCDQFPVVEWALREGIRDTRLTGRMQALPDGVNGIMDVAHNAQSIAYLAEKIKQSPITGKTVAVFSMLGDKNMPESIESIHTLIDEWHVAEIDNPRAAKLDDITSILREKNVQKIHIHRDPASAYQAATASMSEEDRVIVFGSFYVITEILQQ